MGQVRPSFFHARSRKLTPPPLLQRTAKVWTNFQLVYNLVGHTQSVWAVASIEGGQYLTGVPLSHLSHFHLTYRTPLPQARPIKQ
jgi:hypothetical protein